MNKSKHYQGETITRDLFPLRVTFISKSRDAKNQSVVKWSKALWAVLAEIVHPPWMSALPLTAWWGHAPGSSK